MPLPLLARAQRKLPRVRKFVGRWIRTIYAGDRVNPRAVFVLGAQRSGTRLPLHVLEQSSEIITYSEGSAPFFSGVLLRDDHAVLRALKRLPFPRVVLKPICESHRAPELLATFAGARVIWIYRHYRETVNSAVVKWKTGKRNLKRVATRDRTAGWRLGGLTPEKLALASRLYSDDMSLHAAEAVMWYLRTALFFDLGLAGRSDVLLVKYEDLVTAPEAGFSSMFSFLECPFDQAFLRGVYASSVRSQSFPEIPQEIERLCADLMERLDSHQVNANPAIARPR
jgi:sulfotransferase family protein